eukprot:CAMPEP_0194130072 /NCGR_PEP_ID=MMETSP0152-20130528/1222_1 /TAXON_ID=1049557 /ORGANISM="Thalassiothrix antarctica, Strain L6-D1" /LENGTH=375 /DNA_ID=CAMNT_0038824493 /DNA_START=54 /DNA_END=1181 /DNA_ORIENTATION=+
MLRFGKLCVLLLLLCEAFALKGSRSRSRGLKESSEEKTTKGENDDKTGNDGKTDSKDKTAKGEGEKEKDNKEGDKKKDDKEGDKKKDNKEGEKKKGGSKKENSNKKDKESKKKCKEDKKKKDTESDRSRRLNDESENSDDMDSNDMSTENEPECLDIKVNADCDALKDALDEGRDLSVPENADDSASGVLKLEATMKEDDAMEQMDAALDKLALSLSNCKNSNKSRRKLQDSDDEENSDAELNGITIDTLEKSTNDCSESDDSDCVLYETPFTIYFSGDVSNDHLYAMAYELADEVKEESDSEAYDEYANIHYVSATISEGDLIEAEKSREKASGNIGGIVGATVGGVAVVGGGTAGYMYYKSRQGAAVNPTAAK